MLCLSIDRFGGMNLPKVDKLHMEQTPITLEQVYALLLELSQRMTALEQRSVDIESSLEFVKRDAEQTTEVLEVHYQQIEELKTEIYRLRGYIKSISSMGEQLMNADEPPPPHY